MVKKIIAVVLIIFAAISFPIKAQANALQYCSDTNSRAVYWLEDLIDQTSNHYDLTNHNSVSFVTGNFNNAADFGSSNTNKYLDVAGNLGITGGNMTVSVWVKVNTEPAANTNYTLWIWKDENVSNTEIWLRYRDVSGTKQLFWGRTRSGIAGVTQSYNVTLGTTNWHHVVLTYDSFTGNGRLYLDGSYVGISFNQTGTGNTTAASRFAIGTFIDAADLPSSTEYASVKIDEIVVDSTVWSTTTIGNVFNRVNLPIGCPASAIAQGNLWQQRSFEGNGFITTTNEITVSSTSETDFVLIKNPSASGKLHRSNDFILTVRTENQNVKVRIYKNPTITSNGTQFTINNVRTSGNSPVSLAYSLPTISARGTLIAAYSKNADSLNRSFDLSLYLEQNESFLVTVEGSTVRNDYILTYSFVEE